MNNFHGRAKLNDNGRTTYELGELADARAHYAEMTKLKPPRVAGEDAPVEFLDPVDCYAKNETPKDTDENVVRGDFGRRKPSTA